MNFSPEELWKLACDQLAGTVSPGVFKTWIAPNRLVELNEVDEELICTLEVPSTFHISIIEKSFKRTLEETLTQITQQPAQIRLRVGNLAVTADKKTKRKKTGDQQSQTLDLGDNLQTSTPVSPTVQSLFSQTAPKQAEEDLIEYKIRQAGLNSNYTFDTFAVSSTNEMAHAAAVAVSQNPGKAYNVLFLYGGVGVGKTHLMQAVGQNILKNNPGFTLLYRTGEEFMNEIVEAIQLKKTIQLKQRYRSVQILLIDDIQFMAGKRSMQEEFFHTFNSVLKAGGQVLLTSDRAPHEIHPLDDRIQSRLEGGLTIDIQQPSFELRTAIVLIKAKQIAFSIPMDIAQRVASAITSTRKLEGIVKVLHSEHMLRHQPITHELVDRILKNQRGDERIDQKIQAKPLDIIKTIANQYHIKLIDIRGPKRSKNIATARHIAMFLLKEELDLPYTEIGRYFSGRDHTSIMHAVRKIEGLLPNDEELRTQIQAIKTSLSGVQLS